MKRCMFAAMAALVLAFFGVQYLNVHDNFNEQTKLIEDFYKNAAEVRGVPSKDTIEKLSPYLSIKLRDALLQALVDEEAHIRETKGEEAPLFEGPMFLGVWEGAQDVLNVKRESGLDKTSYVVTFQVKNSHGKDPSSSWKDRVVLVQENGKWVVEDLVFQVGSDSPKHLILTNLLEQVGEDCFEPLTQLEMNQCASQSFKREDARFKNYDQQLAVKLDVQARQLFKSVQQAWLNFRAQQCSFETAAYEGGSIAPMVYATCMADLTQQRNKALASMLNSER